MTTSPLDFTIRIATTLADLREACRVRAESYGHHVPELGERFGAAETLDHAPGTMVLLARCKSSGRGIGTARIQTSAFGPLLIDASATLPAALAGATRAEITRLAVCAGADAQVKAGLMKAAYLYCVACQVRWLVIGARSDALIRNYRALGFSNALPGGEKVPLAHAGGVPHLLLAFDVTAAERTWQASGHRLYGFMVGSFHPDLQLFDAQPLRPLAQRPPRRVRAATCSRRAWLPRGDMAGIQRRGAQRANSVASSSRV